VGFKKIEKEGKVDCLERGYKYWIIDTTGRYHCDNCTVIAM